MKFKAFLFVVSIQFHSGELFWLRESQRANEFESDVFEFVESSQQVKANCAYCCLKPRHQQNAFAGVFFCKSPRIQSPDCKAVADETLAALLESMDVYGVLLPE